MKYNIYEWLENNKIKYTAIDNEIIEIPQFGKVFVQNMDNLKSIFRTTPDGETIFNAMEDADILLREGVCYIAFEFGDNWYYCDVRDDFSLNILKYVGEYSGSNKNIDFVHLGVHTGYELLNGSYLPKRWVKKCKFLGQKALGVCDKNTMAALYNLQKEAKANDITPVFGYSFSFTYGNDKVGAKLYAQTQQGLRNLLRVQKAVMVDNCDEQIITYDELLKRSEGNVLVLDKYSSEWIKNNDKEVEGLINGFKKVYYQVDLSEYKAERIDIEVLKSTKLYFDELYKTSKVRPILIGDSYYLDKDNAKNKIILNKVAEGAAHEQSDEQYYKDIEQHYQLFEDTFDSDKYDILELFKECCAPTIEIAENATAFFDNTRLFMPEYILTDEEKEKYGNAHNMFSQLLEKGLEEKIPEEDRERYRKQMLYEKYVIESTNNVDYLLVQYDTVNWCRENNIEVGCGRGSAAGSLLLYLLGVTLIDPLKFDLIFERFLLPERAGLFPAKTTIIGKDIETQNVVEVSLENGKTIRIERDSQLMVERKGKDAPIQVYADQLKKGDNILLDNKDAIFTINEL